MKAMEKLESVTAKYPLLSNIRYNMVLLGIDFKIMFTEKQIHNNILKDWDSYSKFFIRKTFEKTKLQTFDARLLNKEDIAEIRCFEAIHHLLVPRSFAITDSESVEGAVAILARRNGKPKGKPKKRQKVPVNVINIEVLQESHVAPVEKSLNNKSKGLIRKPSINDSKRSTILLINHNQNVQEVIQNFARDQLKQKKLMFHPIMVIIMNENRDPIKYFVYIDHIYMEAPSFKQLLNCYMQSFYVYDLEFPAEGSLVCEFLAELFFKFSSGNEHISTIINDMTAELHIHS
ncbi:hypothetical protein ACFFRR_001194 [Megaselia abdita]